MPWRHCRVSPKIGPSPVPGRRVARLWHAPEPAYVGRVPTAPLRAGFASLVFGPVQLSRRQFPRLSLWRHFEPTLSSESGTLPRPCECLSRRTEGGRWCARTVPRRCGRRTAPTRSRCRTLPFRSPSRANRQAAPTLGHHPGTSVGSAMRESPALLSGHTERQQRSPGNCESAVPGPRPRA